MSGRDHFENRLTAFLQDAYFPEGDVDEKLDCRMKIMMDWWLVSQGMFVGEKCTWSGKRREIS
jgi:hypothetical protein